MRIGLVGKPNVGKSTAFSALTEMPVDIANYPFTTIEPNVGVTWIPLPSPPVPVQNYVIEGNPRAVWTPLGQMTIGRVAYARQTPVHVPDSRDWFQ